ncbi:MAG: ATP-binding protein [Candidatus Promineifilaceae bacterium]
MSFVQALIELLTEAPGSIVYHMVTLLSIQAALGLALWQWRHNRGQKTADQLAQRLVWAMCGILFVRLIVIFTVLAASTPELATRFLPPLEQAIDTVTVAIIVWVFSPRLPGIPRLGDIVLLLILLFTGFMYAFFAQEWIGQLNNGLAASSYLASYQANLWNIFQLLLLAIGVVLVLIGRHYQWVLRLAILFVLLLAHVGQLLSPTFPSATTSDIAYWVRLGNLFAFPLLVVFVYRYNLSQLLADQAVYRTSAEQIGRHLQLSRNVIDSLDINNRLYQSLKMAADFVKAEYTALAVVSLDDRNQLHLVSTHHTADDSPETTQQVRQQYWAMNLADWPAIRLAMQQRQRVELIPNGLGARQLNDIYHELGISGLGSLLIEPLLVPDNELGVLLLAGPADQERWRAESKALSFTVSAFLAQAIQNALQYQRTLQETSSLTTADETIVSGRLIALEQELDQSQTEIESLTARWKHSESQLAAESQRSRDLAAALETAEQFNRDERVRLLEQEIASLRESLIEAEEAMALASAGVGGLSPEWVTMAITRYSSEVEEAMVRIQQLESRLVQQEDSETRALIASLAQEIRTPLTSLSGYSDLLLGESMGILGTKQLSLMRRVQANIIQMSGLLEQLIQLSSRRISPLSNETQVDIREAIETAITSVSSKIREKNLLLNLDLAEDLPPVPSDGDNFYQIVSHLVNNACQVSTADSRILIRAHNDTIRETNSDGGSEMFDFLHLAITDSGNGLSEEIHSLVLEAHRSPEKMSTIKMKDLEHSLSTAVSLVNAQGGRVWLSKEWETGDTFSVLLPLSGNGYVYPNGKPH